MSLMKSSAPTSHPDPTLAELAAQIGLDDQSPVDDSSVEPGALALEDYFEPEAAPETFTTQPAFYNIGLNKAALVGGVSLVIFLGVASIFKVASPGGNATATVAEAPTEETPEDPTLVALRQSQVAESKAKAKLALIAQNNATDPSEASDKAELTPEEAKALKDKTPKPIAKAQPTPIAPSAPPPPQRINPAPTYSTVTPKPKPIEPLPLPSSRLSQRLSPSAPLGNNPPIQAVDPMAEWQRLASLGTYGEVEANSDASAPAQGGDANATLAALFGEGAGATSAPVAIDVIAADDEDFGTATQAAPLSDYFEPRVQPVAHWETVEAVEPAETVEVSAKSVAADEPIKAFAKPRLLAQAPERTILVGSSGQGHLVTPVLWAPDGSRGEARFIVALSEPITDAQGQPALPEGTQFVVAAQNLDAESGLVDLSVMALVIDGQEYEAPEGIFSVRDREGGLLLGELRSKPNQGRGDLARVVTGALSNVGSLLNRPRSSSSTTSNGSFGSSQSSSTQNSDPNYVGAVLEGGFSELSSVIEERQQAAAEALAQAPQLYQLPADYRIRIFVNQSLSL